MADLQSDEIRRRVGGEISHDEVTTLADWYASTARAIANYPRDDLQRVEPPLRSLPGPSA